MINSILAFLFGCLISDWVILRVNSVASYIKKRKIKKEHVSIFNEVGDLAGTKDMKFLGRQNDVVTFKSNLSIGKCEILFFLDRRDLAIFQNGTCAYTSYEIDKVVMLKLCSKLDDVYSKKINDILIVSNMIVDRKTVETMYSSMGIKMGEVVSDVPKKELNIDDILDKINREGIQSLTDDEKRFLDGMK